MRILDLGGSSACELATMLLAETGAEVIRIEPIAGDPSRGSAGFAVRNRSKASLAIDLASEAGELELARLLASADVVVHALPSGALGGLLDDGTIADRFPHLIASRIGSWPLGHPRAGIPTDDALVLAEAGVCDEQPAVSRDGPVFIRFPLADGGAGLLAAAGVAARLLTRDRTGRGGVADTSLVQGALTSMIMYWSRVENMTESLESSHDKHLGTFLFECGDGKWIHVMSAPDATPTMRAGLAAMGEPARLAANGAGQKFPTIPNWGANEIVFRTRPRDYWLEELWAHDVSVQPVLPMGELYFDEQANANGYVVTVDDPELGRTLQPGSPLHVTPPPQVRNPAPRLDDGRALAARWIPRDAPPSPPEEISVLPLAALKVLDLGNFLAGPFAPMLMATMGAEVIKLEAGTGDQLRFVDWAFNACQRGKRSIALNLKDPAARPVLERFVRWADVVHHNLRMPAARKLGLDYEAIRAINPRTVYCHVSSYGAVGPRKDWPGYDQLFQASCGWEYEGAGEGNPPSWYRFGMMDHQCAILSLIGTLLALHRRNRTGEGSFVATSLLGAGMLTLNARVAYPDGTLSPFPPLDAKQMGPTSERRLYRCADGWVMIVAEAPGAMTALLGGGTLAALETTMARGSVAEAIARAEAAGGQAVRAAEAQRDAFFDDPANLASGLIARYPHPRFGKMEQVGSFLRFGETHAKLDLPPPLLGEHSRTLLAEMQFDTAEIEAMIADELVVAS